jgi:hypothetical protein
MSPSSPTQTRHSMAGLYVLSQVEDALIRAERDAAIREGCVAELLQAGNGSICGTGWEDALDRHAAQVAYLEALVTRATGEVDEVEAKLRAEEQRADEWHCRIRAVGDRLAKWAAHFVR